MKKIIYLLAFIVISSTAIGQKTDFSGNWKLNKEKSELGEQFSMAPGAIEITHEINLLSETRHSNIQGDEYTFKNKYTLDGKECENKGWMESVIKSTANWSDDKKELHIVSKIPMQDGAEMTVTSNYSIKEKNMVIKTTASSSYGDFSEVQVYEKD